MEVAAVIVGLIIFNGLTLFLETFYSLLQTPPPQKKTRDAAYVVFGSEEYKTGMNTYEFSRFPAEASSYFNISIR